MVTTNGVHEDASPKTEKKGRGFRIPEKTAHLTFEDDYEGAEVWVRLNVSFGEFLKIQQTNTEEDYGEMAQRFGDVMLVSWNLENDDGSPISADADGMMAIPVEFATMIVNEWVAATTGIPDPLGEGSDGLNTLAEASTVLDG